MLATASNNGRCADGKKAKIKNSIGRTEDIVFYAVSVLRFRRFSSLDKSGKVVLSYIFKAQFLNELSLHPLTSYDFDQVLLMDSNLDLASLLFNCPSNFQSLLYSDELTRKA